MKILLFDVDNTLTPSRGTITPHGVDMIRLLKIHGYHIGCVSGSDYSKLKEQLGDAFYHFDWVFAENGLVTYFQHQLYSSTNIVKFLGEQLYGDIVNECLKLLSEIKLPIKRGTFIELRTGLLNICPIGRSCSKQERDNFELYDNLHKVREEFRTRILKKFDDRIECSIGGQISLDIFPIGWNKTYCLQFIDKYSEIHFFGDRICPGGNDFEIANHKRVTPFLVKNCDETYEKLKSYL